MGIEILFNGLLAAELARRTGSNDGSHLLFSHKEMRGTSIVGASFLSSQFKNCTFSHCFFERCYFRKSSFTHVSFTGCRFVDCAFSGASFDQCDLSFTSYSNCSITYRQVEKCLPDQQNVLHDLARELRMNAQNRGDKENVRLFLRQELLASERHNYKKWREINDRYYSKYTLFQRVEAFIAWSSLKTTRFLWGYGESWLAVLRLSAILILVFAIFYWKLLKINGMPAESFWDYLLFSLATFTTLGYGSAFPESLWGRFWTNIESAVGLLVYGLLAAVFYTRFSRRDV